MIGGWLFDNTQVSGLAELMLIFHRKISAMLSALRLKWASNRTKCVCLSVYRSACVCRVYVFARCFSAKTTRAALDVGLLPRCWVRHASTSNFGPKRKKNMCVCVGFFLHLRLQKERGLTKKTVVTETSAISKSRYTPFVVGLALFTAQTAPNTRENSTRQNKKRARSGLIKNRTEDKNQTGEKKKKNRNTRAL